MSQYTEERIIRVIRRSEPGLPMARLCRDIRALKNVSCVTLLSLASLLASICQAQDVPRPPCGTAPWPAHAEVGAQPNMAILTGASAASWQPPNCTGWRLEKRDFVIALSARFARDGGGGQLLERIGSISTLRDVRYWSVTDKAWRVLITDAAALVGRDPEHRRGDFSAEELKSGNELFTLQTDSRLGKGVYRLRIREAGANRIVVESENATPLSAMFLPAFKTGDLKSVYFLEREPGGVWRYYALVSATSAFAPGNQASLVNRATALYRHLAGIPTDTSPPAAP